MKPLQNMNNMDKGKLLATLFPEQIAAILESLKANYLFLIENEDSLRATWDNGLLAFDFWYRQAAEIAEIVMTHGARLENSSSHFAGQLFRGHNAIYTIDSIIKHSKSLPPLAENKRYALGVRLLFDHYTAAP